MIKKLPTLLVLLFIQLHTFSQEKKTTINGKILDSLGIVKNAHIINIKTHQGTFSSDEGSFRMFVSVGDSLQVSTIQHHTKKIVITKNIFDTKNVAIFLTSNVFELDEFDLKLNNLSGILGVDSKNLPVNKKDSLLRKLMDFSDVNMKIVEGDDHIDQRVRPPVVNTMRNSLEGVGAAAKLPFKNSERLWALRKKLAINKAFPYKIMSELGENFFFTKLQIPIENYFHFLEYCNPLGIENLHNNGKILEVINILQRESVPYLKIINIE
ncbi:hypothetical protein [Polaribacter sp.]|uniref:hypothetical protein n=1 Tax=Polaribacter sp. TaxID=1920175 RepID=UPI003EF2FA6D